MESPENFVQDSPTRYLSIGNFTDERVTPKFYPPGYPNNNITADYDQYTPLYKC